MPVRKTSSRSSPRTPKKRVGGTKPRRGGTAPVDPSAPASQPPVRTGERSDPKAVRDFAIEAARLVRDDKCEEVVLLDLRGLSSITDFAVIASGTSERQMRSVLQHVEELGASRGFKPFRASTDDRAAWLLIDFVDVVVHLFEPNTRAHYDLEMLWGDAPRVEWERDDQKERDRAGIARPRVKRVEEEA